MSRKRTKTSEVETATGVLMEGETKLVDGQTISKTKDGYACSCEAAQPCEHVSSYTKPQAEVAPVRRSRRAKKDVDYTLEAQEEEKGSANSFGGVMLASKYTGEEDITGWLMSEKLDGVRCVWTGECMVT